MTLPRRDIVALAFSKRSVSLGFFHVLSAIIVAFASLAFAIILYFLMTDFVKIALSTDYLEWSAKPDVWNVTGLVKVSTTLSLLVIASGIYAISPAVTLFVVSCSMSSH